MSIEKVVIRDCTLIRGDCLEVLPTLGKVDAVVTDPPYNCGKNYGTHNDSMTDGEYRHWAKARVQLCRDLAENQFWVAPRYKLDFWSTLLPNNHLIVIPRGAAGPFRQGWSDQFEIALAVGKPTSAPSDLWTGIRLKREGYFFREETYDHPGYTPLPIMERAVQWLSSESVCDPFLGTGTTAVACIKHGRRFIGIEIEPRYFEIACKRIERAYADQALLDLIEKPKEPEQGELFTA